MTIHRPGTYSGAAHNLYDSPVESVYVEALPLIAATSIETENKAGGETEYQNFSRAGGAFPVLTDWTPVLQTFTDESGAFELMLAPGSYNVSFSKESWDTFVTGQIDIELDMILTGQDVILRSPGSLTGVVSSGGTPVQNVHVVVEDSNSVVIGEDYTSVTGAYLIQAIYDGYYLVSFTHTDYLPVAIDDFHVTDGPGATTLNQTLVQEGYAYLPGDANMYNGQWPPEVIGGDVTYLVSYFRGLPTNLPCYVGGFWCSGDANGDCQVIGSDVTKLVSYFRGIADLEFCADYQPLWLDSDDCPAEAPAGWPNCESPVLTGKSIEGDSGSK